MARIFATGRAIRLTARIFQRPPHYRLESAAECHTGSVIRDAFPEDGKGDTILIDIGTTTIAFALISRKDRKLHQHSAIENPQRCFGADVIARILASCEGKGEQLQTILIQAIQTETARLCNNNKQKKEAITSCYVGGNTTMLHLLMGYDCTPLSHSPFIVEQRIRFPHLSAM